MLNSNEPLTLELGDISNIQRKTDKRTKTTIAQVDYEFSVTKNAFQKLIISLDDGNRQKWQVVQKQLSYCVQLYVSEMGKKCKEQRLVFIPETIRLYETLKTFPGHLKPQDHDSQCVYV